METLRYTINVNNIDVYVNGPFWGVILCLDDIIGYCRPMMDINFIINEFSQVGTHWLGLNKITITERSIDLNNSWYKADASEAGWDIFPFCDVPLIAI